jgi:hypothetical protein
MFKPTIGNDSLHQDINDNCVKIVNFVTSQNLVVKSMMFPHRNIHTYTWTSPEEKTHNQMLLASRIPVSFSRRMQGSR